MPGLTYHVLDGLVRYMNLSVVDMIIEDAFSFPPDCDMLANTIDNVTLQENNMTAAATHVFDYVPSVVTCNRPMDVEWNLFGAFKPFQWPVWLLVVAFVLTNRLYSQVVSQSSSVGDVVRHGRPTFVASLLPLTFGLMLLTGLYRSRLLTTLLLKDPIYMVWI